MGIHKRLPLAAQSCEASIDVGNVDDGPIRLDLHPLWAVFAEDVVLADLQPGRFAAVFQVLRRLAQDGESAADVAACKAASWSATR